MKNRHGGILIHETKDEYGIIDVIEFKQTIRGLHFGNKTQQSGMFLYNSVILINKYTQAMLTTLIWKSPEKSLILGLGAGSIAKYLLHFFPDIHIDAVDLRPEVIKIAHEYFNLPKPDNNFNIHYSSAEDYLDKDIESKYDLILIDLFLTFKAKDISVDINDNIEKLAKILSHDGYLCINVLGSNYMNYTGLNQLKNIFNMNIYAIPVESSNVIIIASHNTININESDIDFTTIEKRMGLQFRSYFNKLKAI